MKAIYEQPQEDREKAFEFPPRYSPRKVNISGPSFSGHFIVHVYQFTGDCIMSDVVENINFPRGRRDELRYPLNNTPAFVFYT